MDMTPLACGETSNISNQTRSISTRTRTAAFWARTCMTKTSESEGKQVCDRQMLSQAHRRHEDASKCLRVPLLPEGRSQPDGYIPSSLAYCPIRASGRMRDPGGKLLQRLWGCGTMPYSSRVQHPLLGPLGKASGEEKRARQPSAKKKSESISVGESVIGGMVKRMKNWRNPCPWSLISPP